MEKTIPPGFKLLVTASVLGVCGTGLFSDAAIGLNAMLFALLVAAALLAWHFRDPLPAINGGWPMLAMSVFFAAGSAWRDSGTLQGLAVVAIVVVLFAMRLRGGGRRLDDCGTFEAGVEFGRTVMSFVTTVPRVAHANVRWRHIGGPRAAQLRSVGRGLVAVIPVLLIFGSLLTSADARFEAFAGEILDWDVATIVRRALLFVVCLGIAGAALNAWMPATPNEDIPASTVAWRCGGIEVNLVLVALNVLFSSYVLIQLSYFFGDDALVRGQDMLSYSSYARRGFFELVWLSILLLPTLLFTGWLLRDAGTMAARVYRAAAGALVALVLVIVASAMHRMHLYVDAYGLTELRFYSSVFMVWLTAVYAWFLGSTLRRRPRRFASGVVVCALLTIAALHVANPDAIITRTNLDRLATTNRLDHNYLVALGSDAVPILLEAFGAGEDARARTVVDALRDRYGSPDDDWREWNRSRARARDLLAAYAGATR